MASLGTLSQWALWKKLEKLYDSDTTEYFIAIQL